MRTRQITQVAQEGGLQCDEKDAVEVDSCATQECNAINCEWTTWGDWGVCNAQCQGGTRTRSRTVSQEAQNGGDVCNATSGEEEECNLQPCSDTWTGGDGADVEIDGITFQGEVANSVVTSQKGVESISVKNGAVTGNVQIGLAQDNGPNFDAGKSVVLPYKDATDTDLITVGSQGGHAKVFVNGELKEDLGEIGTTDTLLAKIILDQGASVRVDAIVTPPAAAPESPAKPESLEIAQRFENTGQTSAQNWTIPAAMMAACGMAAVAYHRSRRTAAPDYQPLPGDQPLLA